MATKEIKRIGVLTGGGDCPGLNAVIRAVAKTAQSIRGIEIVGILDGYWGLVSEHFRVLRNEDVSGILGIGGTILGTSRVDPFKEAYRLGQLPSPEENWDYIKEVMKRNSIDALIAIGGDGTLRVASRAAKAGIPVVGVPKTIDNDVGETDVTFGFDSAVSIVMEALDRLHTTAMSHHRVMVVEVMGRTAGWLGLYAGVSGGGDVILLPEFPYNEEIICEKVKERERSGKRFSIVVAAEGARADGASMLFSEKDDGSGRKILGGIGKFLSDNIEAATGLETRVTVLGHLQRGGAPTAHDRLLATQFGHNAVELLLEGRSGEMVAYSKGQFVSVPLERAVGQIKLVPRDHPIVDAARSVGTCFGIAD